MGGGEQADRTSLMGPYRQIILFGDSITQISGNQQYVDDKGEPYWGFAFLPAISDWFVRRFDVLNRGFSGYNTASARIVLSQFMPRPEQATVSLICIFFGANDSALQRPGPDNQHVPIQQYKDNLKAIMHDPSVTCHNPRFLLITPPPIDEYKLEFGSLTRSRKAEITKQYAEACAQVGDEENVPVLDLWDAMVRESGWDLNQPGVTGSIDLPRNVKLGSLLSDGLHFTDLGYACLYREFVAKIRATWPELEEMKADDYDPVFPLWRDAMASLHNGEDIAARPVKH